MKKFKLFIALLISIILTGCANIGGGGNLNVGYNTPKLERFQIKFTLYTTNKKEESLLLTSKDIPSYKYNLLRIDDEHIYLGIKIDDILNKHNKKIHQECVIYGNNSLESAKTTYSTTEDLYIAIYQNNNGPWDIIEKRYGPAILLNPNDSFETYSTKLVSFNAVLTQE